MKNVFVQDEGLDLGSNYFFGNPKKIKNTSYLIEVEYEINGWEIEACYHYRITDDHYLQLISFSDDSPEIIKAQFKRTKASVKENLSNLFRRYLDGARIYNGLPSYIDSAIFSKAEYDLLIQEIITVIKENQQKASAEKTPLIAYLERKELRPKPSGNNSISWVSKCPSGGNHFLMVTTKPDAWGCGYCGRKGGIKELETWFNELDQKKLTKFMKEINSGGIQTKETMNWWLKRY